AHAGRDHRSGRAREAVLHEGFGPVRERLVVAHRRGVARRNGVMKQGGDPEARTVPLLRTRDGGPQVVAAISMEIGTEEIVVPDTVEELLGDLDAETDVPWVVLVWDDPINLMDYVTYVFQKLFG